MSPGHDKSNAPLYSDTSRLCQWLLNHFEDHPQALPQEICRTALALLRAITLALARRNIDLNLDEADQQLIWLRVQLRLAERQNHLSRNQLLYAFEEADTIGRQIGGWLKALGPI